MSIPYPFDPTGFLASNKIINEERAVTDANGINAYLIIPDATPYYGNSLSIVNSSGVTLVENVDYYKTHHWDQATTHTGLPVFGTITLLTPYAVDTYRLNYQTIGGEYVTAPANAITEGLIALGTDYVDLDWSTAPTAFPAVPHTEELSQITGVTQLYHGLFEIAAALNSPARGVHYDDIEDINTQYAVTTVKPILELAIANNQAIDTLAGYVLNIVSQLDPSLTLVGIDPTLQNFTIPLPGNMMLKVGFMVFAYGTEPSSIHFADPAFTTQCIFATANIAFFDNTTPINTDTVRLGRPGTSSVGMKVTYDSAHTTGARIVTYFALGL
jgi:hypothetical protein